ncbi:hypothetical protein ARSEF4850_003736 [Beauveria asiatica]
MLQKLVELLEKSYEEMRELKEETKELKQKVTEQTLAIAKQDDLIGNLSEKATQQGSLIKELQQELRDATAELTEARVQLEAFTAAASSTAASSSRATYAEIARTPPGSTPSNIRTLSSGMTTPSTATDTLFCTIDCSRVSVEESYKVTAGEIRSTLEREMRTEQDSANWRCRAVTRDPKDPARVRIMCRDEKEQQKIKHVAETKLPEGTRVLRDDLHRIRVDNVSRDAVLDQAGVELPNVAELLSNQNDARVTKVAWLSDRFLKQHGSIVVYLEKASEARRLLADGFFLAGELSGRTAPFLRSERPNQCFNCQGIANHKAYQCNKPQLNVRKRGEVHDSLMNDEEIEDAAVIAIQEPQARLIKGRLLTTPMSHHKWTKMVPSVWKEEGRWAIRSMLWVAKDLDAEQVPVESSDMTAALVRISDRVLLVVSVYVEGLDGQTLIGTCNALSKLIQDARHKEGGVVDVAIMGDFNRHDQLWGGDDVSMVRQGEGDAIVNLMNEFSLRSLLPRGTKTWQGGEHESTIDLVLASDELADEVIRCGIYETEHGSDHRTVDTVFNATVPFLEQPKRLLFKNAPWKKINERITEKLDKLPVEGTVQQSTDRLMSVVLEVVHALTPRAKPSPYAKRWWTSDLTQLRQVYTHWRNKARSARRAGCIATQLEATAKAAAKQYHDAIRQQKKSHWDEFMADNDNIWKAAKYLKSGDESAFGKVPQLVRADNTTTTTVEEQAEELLSTFFPPLPDEIQDEAEESQRGPVPMPEITMEEVERQLCRAKSWKAPGEDGLPVAVWKEIWPSVRNRVLSLFQASLDEGVLPDQWRHAKIIPLKKPGKENYAVAKTWRPISLLSTLGKILEAVIAERISYAVETFGLLPTNHFGARKQRSAEQALLLLQEQIYNAWR